LHLERWVAVGMALLFLWVAGGYFVNAWVDDVYFWHQWRFDCLAALSVDFSAPGTYSASFRHWRSLTGPDTLLGLDVPKKTLAEVSPGELVAGLEGTFSIRDENGVRIFWGPLIEDPNMVSARKPPGMIDLRRFDDTSAYGPANWQIDVIVTKGAPRLKGVPQRLVLIASRFVFSDLPKACMWLPLIVAVLILMGVEGSRYQDKKRPKSSKEPPQAK